MFGFSIVRGPRLAPASDPFHLGFSRRIKKDRLAAKVRTRILEEKNVETVFFEFFSCVSAGLSSRDLADVSGTPTLSAASTLNLDTGTTGTSGGDILWTGSGISSKGRQKL